MDRSPIDSANLDSSRGDLGEDLLQVTTRATIVGASLRVGETSYEFDHPWGERWESVREQAGQASEPGSTGLLTLEVEGASSPFRYPFVLKGQKRELILDDGSRSGIYLNEAAVEWTPGARPPLGTSVFTATGDKFVFIRQIGSGGTATVFEGESVDGARVAIKVPSDDRFVLDDRALRRFAREAENLSTIDHPHVLRAIGSALGPEGQPALVTELASHCLDDVLRGSAAPPLDEALKMLHQILEGVAAIHRAGFIHRDLSAKNVFAMIDGRLVVGDFGTTKKVGDQGLTRPEDVMGSFVYVAPEQFHNVQDATFASDVYSVGCVAFYLLVGRRPFGAEPPLAAGDSLPAPLAHFVDRLRSYAPGDRPEDGATALSEYDKVLSVVGPGDTSKRERNPYGGLNGKMLDRMLTSDGWEQRSKTDSHRLYWRGDVFVAVALPSAGGLSSKLVEGITRQAGYDPVTFAELRARILRD